MGSERMRIHRMLGCSGLGVLEHHLNGAAQSSSPLAPDDLAHHADRTAQECSSRRAPAGWSISPSPIPTRPKFRRAPPKLTFFTAWTRLP